MATTTKRRKRKSPPLVGKGGWTCGCGVIRPKSDSPYCGDCRAFCPDLPATSRAILAAVAVAHFAVLRDRGAGDAEILQTAKTALTLRLVGHHLEPGAAYAAVWKPGEPGAPFVADLWLLRIDGDDAAERLEIPDRPPDVDEQRLVEELRTLWGIPKAVEQKETKATKT